MIKKEYLKPAMQVVKIQHQAHLLVNSVQNDEGFNFDGPLDDDDV